MNPVRILIVIACLLVSLASIDHITYQLWHRESLQRTVSLQWDRIAELEQQVDQMDQILQAQAETMAEFQQWRVIMTIAARGGWSAVYQEMRQYGRIDTDATE